MEKELIENAPTIIVNNVFAGGYCLDGNIGHEIINFYKADGGKHYCYINPYGEYLSNSSCIVLFVQHYSTKKYLVIAKAEVINHKQDIDKDRQITYGKVPMSEIFTNNTEIDKVKALISYDVVKFFKTANPIILETESDYGFKSSLPLRRLHTVRMPNDKYGDEYEYLKKIIDCDDNWIEEEVDEVAIPKNLEQPCFLELIGKGKYELAFSNLFAYLFNLRQDIFTDFYKEKIYKKTKIDIEKGTKFKIEREHKNIDIFMDCFGKENGTTIVIENKVKSLINGQKQVDDESGKIISQLTKYYEYVTDEYKGKRHIFLIFAPDYSNVEEEKKIHKYGEKYVVIKYSEIYDYYKDKSSEFAEIEFYFKEFLKGLALHINTYDRSIENNVKRAFINRIYEVSKDKN